MSIFDDWRDIIARDLNWNNGNNRTSWSERAFDKFGVYDYVTQRKPLLTDQVQEIKEGGRLIAASHKKATESNQAYKAVSDWGGRQLGRLGQGIQFLDEAGQDHSNLLNTSEMQAAYLVGNAMRAANYVGSKSGEVTQWFAEKTGLVDKDAARFLGEFIPDLILGSKGASKAFKSIKAATKLDDISKARQIAGRIDDALHPSFGSGPARLAKQSFNQSADGVYNISKSQKGALKEKLVAEVAANKGSKRGIKHRAIVAGELDEKGKKVLRFLRWNGPKNADRSLLKHWSFSKVSAQAKAAANRAIGELGPLSHKEFRLWARKLGYTNKQINAYAEYVEKSIKAYEKEMLDVNKILRKKGVRREDLTTLAHNQPIEPHGIHSTRNIDFEQLSKNVSEGKHSAKPRSSQIATGVPHYSDKLKNWKADFLYYFDQKHLGGLGILPQKHQIARHIELMIEQAARGGGSDAVDDLLELLDL